MFLDVMVAALLPRDCQNRPTVEETVFCVMQAHPAPPTDDSAGWCEWQKQLMREAGAEIDPDFYCVKE